MRVQTLLKILYLGLMPALLLGCGSGGDSDSWPAGQSASGITIKGSGTVLINGLPAARSEETQTRSGGALTDETCRSGTGIDASSDVMINGRAAARLVDPRSRNCESSSPVAFSDNVLIGD